METSIIRMPMVTIIRMSFAGCVGLNQTPSFHMNYIWVPFWCVHKGKHCIMILIVMKRDTQDVCIMISL